jgi:hypothetical protein
VTIKYYKRKLTFSFLIPPLKNDSKSLVYSLEGSFQEQKLNYYCVKKLGWTHFMGTCRWAGGGRMEEMKVRVYS